MFINQVQAWRRSKSVTLSNDWQLYYECTIAGCRGDTRSQNTKKFPSNLEMSPGSNSNFKFHSFCSTVASLRLRIQIKKTNCSVWFCSWWDSWRVCGPSADLAWIIPRGLTAGPCGLRDRDAGGGGTRWGQRPTKAHVSCSGSEWQPVLLSLRPVRAQPGDSHANKSWGICWTQIIPFSGSRRQRAALNPPCLAVTGTRELLTLEKKSGGAAMLWWAGRIF